MDAVTVGAVLLAILSGAAGEAGQSLWDSLSALVRRPFKRRASRGRAATPIGDGKTELVAFEHAPADEGRAVALATALIARAQTDPDFRAALEDWWQQASLVVSGKGNVFNTISGGIQMGPVLMGRDINATFQTAPPVPVALTQLPSKVAGFAGRDDELAMLMGLLNPAVERGPVLVWAVSGLAGVGKTTLAVEAGHAARELGWFRGGFLFIDLHGYDEAPVAPAQALDALCRALGVPGEHVPPDEDMRAALYRSMLAQINEPVLVIADNASSESQVKPLLPGVGPHRVLVTSRHTLAGLGARLVDVTVMNEESAVALLHAALRVAHPEDDRVSADQAASKRLAQICGGLPLALQIVAASLKADPTRTISEFADDLTAERLAVGSLRYDEGSGSGASVATAFEMSYRRLDEISSRIFRALPVDSGPDISTAAVAALADLPSGPVHDVLAGLARAHLIEHASRSAHRWKMHDLLRQYAQWLSDQLAESDSREQARDRLLNFYLNKSLAADAHLRALPGMDLPQAFTDRSDALSWLEVERPNLVAAVTAAAATGRDAIAIRLPRALGAYLMSGRHFDDLLATNSISVNVARRINDRSGEARALVNIGTAMYGLRDFEGAITAFRDGAAIHHEVGDRVGEGMAVNNLGPTLCQVRRFEDAIITLRRATGIWRDVGNQQMEATSLGNLGGLLCEVGRYQDAIVTLEEAAAIYSQIGDRLGEAITANNLGETMQHVGRFEDAIARHKDAVVIYREVGDRHGEASATDNLGKALLAKGLAEEAIKVHRDAVAIYRETNDRHDEGSAVNNLGKALLAQGRTQEAITALRAAITIYRETNDPYQEAAALKDLENAERKHG